MEFTPRHNPPTVLPPSAGPALDVPHAGPSSEVRMCTVDLDFAALALTDTVKRLTRQAAIGWRIDGDRLLGWLPGRLPYERLIDLTGTLIDLTDAFPGEVWHRDWPRSRRR